MISILGKNCQQNNQTGIVYKYKDSKGNLWETFNSALEAAMRQNFMALIHKDSSYAQLTIVKCAVNEWHTGKYDGTDIKVLETNIKVCKEELFHFQKKFGGWIPGCEWAQLKTLNTYQ